MERLDRLEAIEAIRALKARYFRLIDTKQWDALRGVFTADLRIVTPEGILEPEDVMRRASDPVAIKGPPGPASLRRKVATTVKTGLKDVRKALEARRFRGAGLEGPWRS